MKMKKSLLAMMALGSVAGVARADIPVITTDTGSIQVYGVADAMVGNQQHSYNLDSQFPGSAVPVGAYKIAAPAAGAQAAGSVTGLMNGGISPSRFGIKGDMDAGEGIKAFFVFESGINITTGRLSSAGGCLADNSGPGGQRSDCANSSINGQLFSRQAFVGLSDDKLGSLALGRNYAPMFDIVSVYDPVQNAQLFSPLGFSGTFGGGGGISEDTRVDGSLKYSNKIGAFNFGGLYKFGGMASDYSAQSGYALNGGYDAGRFGVQAAYEAYKDGMKGVIQTVTNNAVGVQVNDTKAYMIAAKYKITDAATAKIGYESYTIGAPSNAASFNTTAITGFYGYNVASVTANANFADSKTNIVWIGGDYNFTQKFNLSAGLYDINALQSNSQTSGKQVYWSLLADYHLTKSLDTYAGLMHASFSGSAYPAATFYTANQIFGIGARFKF